MNNFTEKIWACAKKIPRGKVISYEGLARMAGSPRAARAVGNAMRKNLFRDPRLYKDVPCHRVVRSDGSVGGFARGTEAKINLLRKEGVKIINKKVDPKHILS